MEEIRRQVESLGFKVMMISGQNPQLRRTTVPFVFPSYDSSRLRKLARAFDYPEAVARGRDEFDRQMRLARWVNEAVCRKPPVAAVEEPFEILRLSRERRAGFYCTHFSLALAACAHSLGMTARKLGIDSLHKRSEPSTHHGTNEFWSSSQRKWFIVDAMHGVYYVRGGTLLSAHDLDGEWKRNRGRDVRIVSLSGRPVKRSQKHVVGDRHESSAYHFFYTPLTVVEDVPCGGWRPQRLVYYEDAERARQTWWQGKRRHVGYAGAFLPTRELDDFYFDVNAVQIFTQPMPSKALLKVSFPTFTPNLSHFLVSFDGGPWRRIPERRPWTPDTGGYVNRAPAVERYERVWRLHPGRNSIAARPVNRFGVEGATSTVEMTLTR